MIEIIIVWAVIIGWVIYKVYISNQSFNQSSYKKITGNSYLTTMLDKGKKGEYLVYKYLKNYEEDGNRFLFNVYIPKGENCTTEIDVLLISNKGLFVFESKNYSGWIFGNEKQKTWTQCLPQNKGSHKEKFYNPIMQNKTHIKYLKAVLDKEVTTHSVIVFSERCELKNITLYNDDVKVIKRYNIKHTIDNIMANEQVIIMQEDIDVMYNMLYPYTQVEEEVKKAHIDAINASLDESVEKMEEITTESDIGTESKEEVSAKEETETKEKVEAEGEKNCPKCGQKLVLRVAKKGKNVGNQFYGCSAYPKCHYIEQ